MALVSLTACDKDDVEIVVPEVTAGRTVLIYMAAENNLGYDEWGSRKYRYANDDLAEIKEGVKNIGDNHLVVYVDKCNDTDAAFNRPQPYMLHFYKGALCDSIPMEETLTADGLVLENVMKKAFTTWPAKSYALSLWGHGSGWVISSDSIEYYSPSRAYGGDTGDNSHGSAGKYWMNIPTMRKVLTGLPHLDYIFCDCCNMMCLEMGYELRDVADYIIGSPAEIPGCGAPYQTVVPAMFETSTFYTSIVDRYFEQQADGYDVPLSVIKTSEMANLASATKTVLKTIEDKFVDSEGNKTDYPDMQGLIYYYYDMSKKYMYYDANDFILKYASTSDYQTWKQALDKAVVYKKMATMWMTNKPWYSFLFKEKDLSDFYSSRYVFKGREEDMIENYIDEPQLIRKNWHEICYVYDDYDIHDIYYDIKAVGLSGNSFFPLCSQGFNYNKDIEIDSLTSNGEPASFSQYGHSITFKIDLHNSQIAKVHIIYKEYMNDNILSNQEREHRQIYRTEYYGIHKSLQGQMAKFSLILKGNFDIVNFKNYFLIRNKKNLNEKEYFWGGVVPYEGKMTLITLSKRKAVWEYSVTLTIRSNYNLNRTALAVPIEFIGGNNEIINIKYSSPQTRDILLDQENRQYVIKYRNVHNNIGEFTIEGQLENKSSGEWEVDLTDDEIERKIPGEDKLCKPQLRKIAKKIIEEFDKENKNTEFEFLDYMKIALWVKENIKYV